MIRLGRRTGYEIKQLVDVSTRFFWAASYGQIYPELRRLEEQGLIRGKDAATNGRARREFELTPAGDEAFDGWLRSDEPLTLETRDEGLLKLFFSDGLAPDEHRALLRSMRERHEAVVTSLESIEDAAREKGGGPYEVLRFGLSYHNFCAERLAEMENEVA
jgi:PadR family transcriptional regulator AphA